MMATSTACTPRNGLDAFPDGATFAAALINLHNAAKRHAPDRGGVAITFSAPGVARIAPTPGPGPFGAPARADDGRLHACTEWHRSASAHARLALAAHTPHVAEALWDLLEAFIPDISIEDVPTFVLAGPMDAPRLALAVGPVLRAGPRGVAWTENDVPHPIAHALPILWDLALRARAATGRWRAGSDVRRLMRSDSAQDANTTLRLMGAGASWVVAESPILLKGLAKGLTRGQDIWSDDPPGDLGMKAFAQALAKLHAEASAAGLENVEARLEPNGAVTVATAHDPNRTKKPATTAKAMAKKALLRVGRSVPLFGTAGTALGARPMLSWSLKGAMGMQKWTLCAAGYRIDEAPWGDHAPTGFESLAIGAKGTGPWWMACTITTDGTFQEPRLVQATTADEAGASFRAIAKHENRRRTGWWPFRNGLMAVWKLENIP